MKKYYFDEDGVSVVTKTNDLPREWTNINFSGINKSEYVSYVTNTGKGNALLRDIEGNECNLATENRTIYLMDDETQEVWSIAGFPVKSNVNNYTCRFKPHETIISSVYKDVFVSQRVFVPVDETYEVWTVTIENRSNTQKTINVIPFVESLLNGFTLDHNLYFPQMKLAGYHDSINGIFAENICSLAPAKIYKTFLLSSGKNIASSAIQSKFHKGSHNFHNPYIDTAWKGHFSDVEVHSLNLTLKNKITLKPAQSKIIHYAFGYTSSIKSAEKIYAAIKSKKNVDNELNKREKFERELSSKVTIKTGVERVDNLINHWVKKQMRACLAIKSGLRDNTQIDLAYSMIDSKAVHDNIITLLSFQYEEGYFVHTSRPLNTRQYSDKPTWFLFTIPELIKETNDFSILKEKVPYLDKNNKKTQYTETVWQHMLRAMRFLEKDVGAHGMNLMHFADWNDQMTGLSTFGKGESTMATFLYCKGLYEIIKLAEVIKDTAVYNEAKRIYELFKKKLNKHAWDGEWFNRGYTGKGKKFGSKSCKEGKIFINSQSWAIISKIANKEQTDKIIKNLDKYIETDLGMRVLYPSYTQYDPDIGSITAHPLDMAGNGVYNHAGSFMITADCIAGRNEHAWRLVKKLVPDSELNPIEQSGCEPFSITNSYNLNSNYYGQAGRPWNTSTSAWVFRGLIEYIFGIRRDYDGLIIDPCLSKELKKVYVYRRFRNSDYHFTLDNTSLRCKGTTKIIVNGQEIEGNKILTPNKSGIYHVTVIV